MNKVIPNYRYKIRVEMSKRSEVQPTCETQAENSLLICYLYFSLCIYKEAASFLREIVAISS